MAEESDSDQNLHTMRHSLAHIMAAAIQRLWPEVKFGVGPVTDHGFYYDVDLGEESISKDDLSKIEEKMQAIIEEDLPFEQFELEIDEAIEKVTQEGQTYKRELLEDLKEHGTTNLDEIDAEGLGTDADKAVQTVSFYRSGEFEDLCRGPHVESTSQVGAFKLDRLAGAYWRGDEENTQLQRVYGVAFETEDELDEFFELREKAAERDHKKIGQELGLFLSSDLVGSGLPLFTPKGAKVRQLLENYSRQIRKEYGFQEVWIPHLTKTDLYKASGHWDKFGDELFMVESQETSDELVLKPMNCPHHTQIYANQTRSYRDLPIKYMENATVYRDEKSGELHGLSRVRSITMDDNHVFCQPDQIAEVVEGLIQAAQELYDELGMELKLALSFRDESDAYLGDQALWEKAQSKLQEIAGRKKLDFKVEQGEAAFYGPKMDYVAIDALGREWELATVQLDFVQPERLDLEYIDEDDNRQNPVMIHAALLGSTERFLSVYIEHTAGAFPFWLAPEQVRILTINDEVMDYVGKITDQLGDITLMEPLKYNELRYSVDDRNESLGKKIRDGETEKVPLLLIVGPKDEADGIVSTRTQDGEDKVELEKLPDFIAELV